MRFPKELYEYLATHTLIGVKGGKERDSFLNIWMVVVDGRVFARTWGKSERSWYTAFLETGEGQIRFGDRVIDVKGRKPERDPELTKAINAAYVKRFNQPENLPYAEGITKPEYEDYTMEFFYEGDG